MKLVDKTAVQLVTVPGKSIIRDLRSLEIKPFSTSSTAPSDAVARGQASIMVGAYRGALAYIDLDKLVVQPLVTAEKQSVMGMLDGRLAGYDIVTVTSAIGAAVGTVYRARLTVPAGQVWFLSNMEINAVKDTVAVSAYDINWRCSLWPDVVAVGGTPDADGQAYLPTDAIGTNAALAHKFAFGPTPITTNAFSTFSVTGTLKPLPTLLRLPGGTVLTLQATVRLLAPGMAVGISMAVAGYVGKALVS
jgi:hypothetical protein